MFSSSEMEKRAAFALHEASKQPSGKCESQAETQTNEEVDEPPENLKPSTENEQTPPDGSNNKEQTSTNTESGVEQLSADPDKQESVEKIPDHINQIVSGDMATEEQTKPEIVIATDATVIMTPSSGENDYDSTSDDDDEKSVTISHFDLSLFPH